MEALGVLWEASGSLWVPKWRPEATKDGTEDLQERFCGYLKNTCFYKGKHGFWRSGRHPGASGKHPGGIWMLLEGLEASGRLGQSIWATSGDTRVASELPRGIPVRPGFQDTAQVRVIRVIWVPHSTNQMATGYKIHHTTYRIQDTTCSIQDTGIQDTGSNMQHTRYRNKRM